MTTATVAPPLPIDLFVDWLTNGERGISSEAIVTALTGIPVGQPRLWDHPHDPADFRRCERLLRAVPQAREHLHVMAGRSRAWARLVFAWDELVALTESEAPGVFDGRAYGSAPEAYRRMRELTDPERDQ